MSDHKLTSQKVMVTGGAGFIGSALTRELLKEGAHVVVYDNFLYGDMSNLREVEDHIGIVNGDVLGWKVYDAIRRFKIDYVFHLAAEPYIPHSYDNPEKFFDVNVKGAINVAMACKTMGVKRLLHFSSSEVYGSAKYTPMDEKHPTLPLSTYAVSKLAADRLCFVFCHEQGLPVIVARPFNSYGPRETQPYVIPEIISQLARSNTIRLGNIRAKRDFTYVDDLARGAIAIMKSDIEDGAVVNLGSGRSYSIEDLARIVGELMGHKGIQIEIDSSRLRPLDVELLECDYSQARRLTGWQPCVGISEGLRNTVEWYMKNGKSWTWERILPRWHK